MRSLLIGSLLIFTGCGSDNNGGGAAPEAGQDAGPDAALEILRIGTATVSCFKDFDAVLPTDGKCSVMVLGEFRLAYNEYDTALWTMAFNVQAGPEAVATCDGTNSEIPSVLPQGVFFDDLKPLTEYTFRACAWNRTKNIYTQGMTKTITTPEGT